MAGSRHRSTPPPGLTRRRFLASTAAAGTLAALAPALPASGRGNEELEETPRPGRPSLEQHTLFFNLAHEPDAATSTYYLVAGGRQYPLSPITENAGILNAVRQGNRFLRGVPDDQITHAVQNVELPSDAVQLCYVKSNPDTTTGKWSMSSMLVHLPESALTKAHQRCSEQHSAGPLPLSAKRQLYGHPPAQSLDDLLEEHALKDSTDHAAAMIGLHPDLLSVDPDSGAHVHVCHIHASAQTLGLAHRLRQAGPATPQETSGQPNAKGWATMEPLTDDDGAPLKGTKGNNAGLIHYLPTWNGEVASHAGVGLGAVSPGVKNDEMLGADVTGLPLGDPSTKGTIWARHDGLTTVDHSLGTSNPLLTAGSESEWTTQNIETDAGFWVKSWSIGKDEESGQPLLTASFINWHPRFLGIWVQFLDANGKPLALPGLGFKLVGHGSDTTAASARLKLDSQDVAYGMLLGSSYLVFGIPVAPDGAALGVTIPAQVTTVRILAVGLGVLGANDYPFQVWMGGLLTALVNYVAPMIAMALATTEYELLLKPIVAPVISFIGVELINISQTIISGEPVDWIAFLTATGKALARLVLACLAGLGLKFEGIPLAEGLRSVIKDIALAFGAEAAVEDSIPVVGQIMMAIAVAAGAAAIASTTIDVLAVPHYYKWELTRKHDVTVTLKPAQNDANFPAVASYYKVTVLFGGGGTPHVQTLDMPRGTVSALPDVVFKDMPKGGQVNISVGFYSRSNDPNKNDWLAGQGTTGLVDNSQDVTHEIRIQEYQVPITSDTVYGHKQKTTLVNRGGQPRHVWTPTSIPPTAVQADISCLGPGSLCDFRGITVRQGTSQTQGFVGYAWKADSAGVIGCAGGQGQFDLVANLGTSDDPQSGYAVGACGFPNGVQVAYNLIGHQAASFYLDSAAGIVRRVQLDQTPGFDPPSGKRAWGKLNLDSTALLLHPTGKLVSINNANHKIEVLRLPAEPMTDDHAQTHLLADIRSGQGSRPGLITGPSAAAVSPEGVVLILEDQHRIQAFDTGGGPVQFFKKQPKPYFIALTATAAEDTQYVDLAVEFTGYLYVLSFNRRTNQYRMDVYHPEQSETAPISTTRGVNAARLAVDFWRNVYTLNYEILQVPNGLQALAEPSVSLWTPSPP